MAWQAWQHCQPYLVCLPLGSVKPPCWRATMVPHGQARDGGSTDGDYRSRSRLGLLRKGSVLFREQRQGQRKRG